MRRLFLLTTSIFFCFALAAFPAWGQAPSSQSIVADAPPPDLTPTSPSAPPVERDDAIVADPASLLPDLPPLPSANASLLGGTISKLDRVQDVISVQVFGGGKTKVTFDPRTRIFLNDQPATVADLRPGDRIYVDTILDGNKVFARRINLKNTGAVGDSEGVVISYRSDNGELRVRDSLSRTPLQVQIASSTRVVRGNAPSTPAELLPGTLIEMKFGPRQDGYRVANAISILAVPGSDFTFAGQVVSLDLSVGRLVLNSQTDHKTYEIYLNPASVSVSDDLRMGSSVSVLARFEGERYVARDVTVNK